VFPLVLLQAKAVSIRKFSQLRQAYLVSISSPSGEGGENFKKKLERNPLQTVSISSPSGEGGEQPSSQEILGEKCHGCFH